jgi:hypothetical protein
MPDFEKISFACPAALYGQQKKKDEVSHYA